MSKDFTLQTLKLRSYTFPKAHDFWVILDFMVFKYIDSNFRIRSYIIEKEVDSLGMVLLIINHIYTTYIVDIHGVYRYIPISPSKLYYQPKRCTMSRAKSLKTTIHLSLMFFHPPPYEGPIKHDR